MDPTTTALQKIGLKKANWKTLMVAASQEVDIPAASLWDAWSKLENWPLWSKPLHTAAHWIGQPGWKVDAAFEQTLYLGFPVGNKRSAEIVSAVVPGESVVWWKDENGIKSCHIWQFDSLSHSRTRISNVEVFHGTLMGLVKPLVAKNWQRMFEQSVAGLIRQTQQELQAAPTLP